jgi:hypothetical protein
LAAAGIVVAVLAGPSARVAHAAPPTSETQESPESSPSETAPALPEGFVPAKLLNAVEVAYPPELAETQDPPEGQLRVKYVVGVDGVPVQVEVERGLHPTLDAIATQAVSQLRYEAATYQGNAVEVVLALDLEFRPPEPEPEPQPEPFPEETSEPEQVEELAAGESEVEEEAVTGPVRIDGRVLVAGDRTAVANAQVLAVPAGGLPVGKVKKRIYESETEPEWAVRATTDGEGHFELAGIPDGTARLVVLAPGFERFEYVVVVVEGQVTGVKWYLRPLSDNPFRTTVEVEREEMVEVTQRRITPEELSKLPGTQGDALKALQNFPGVARSPFAGGLLVIRGSAPEDSAVFLGYHEIPTLFHFGGLTSVFNSDILTQIDFIPGNFDSRYGDATGGIINVVPREGRRDGYHGYVDSDLFDTGVLVEGPMGKGSFILSGRRSYIDFILPRVIPSDAGLNFTLAPRYYDYQAIFSYPVSKGKLTARAFGSDDRTVLAFAGPNDVDTDSRSSIETTQWFHRADLVYENHIGQWDFLVTPSFQRNFTSIGAFGVFSLNVTADIFSGRAEASYRISERARFRVGTEFVSAASDVEVEAPQFEGDESAVSTFKDTVYAPALYSTLTLAPTEKLSIFPGVRLTAYSGLTDQVTTDPRVRFAWNVGESTTIKGGTGMYSQLPQPFELSNGFGNPNLSPERSYHSSLGFAQAFPEDISLEITGFHKHLWDLTTGSQALIQREGLSTPEFFASTQFGRIYGMEFLFRKNLTKKLFGWVSYTLSKSERKDTKDGDWFDFDFDQTHILTLIASYKLPYNWQIGARFRLTSGNPYTACTDGVYDASLDSFTCIQGPVNGDRLPAFHQLDLRVDKTWIKDLWRFTLYLDVQNAYNQLNTEFQNYSYNFQQNQPITGLPILPSLGLKAEF